MERLTTRIENYVFVSDEHKAIERLAEYEDTGLTPEQIIAMDEEYTKMAKELGEYKRLEEQGRLIKLPCNVGEEVWIIEDINCLIHKGKVESFTRDQHFNRGWLAEIKIAEGVISSCWERFEDFGKIVFLTKAEAEKALEEMEK